MKIKTKKLTLLSMLFSCIIATFGALMINNGANVVSAEENAQIVEFEGEGTETSPYLISNESQLYEFANIVNSGEDYAGKFIKLTADIDLAGKEWTPIGTSSAPFCGMFDGQNYTIKNLKISWSKEYVSGGANQNYAGLFGYMKGGNTAGIKNLTIENADVSGCLYVGVILGRSYVGGIIENCHVKGIINVEAYSYAGIIVGRHEYSSGKNINGENMSIYNCSVEGSEKQATINCDYEVSYVGGIVGFLAEGGYTFSNLSVKNVKLTGTYGVGGISGIGHYGNSFLNMSISDSSIYSINNDTANSRTGNVGIIVGACQGTEKNQTTFKSFANTNTLASINGTLTEEIFGNNMNGSAAITNFVAKTSGKYFESLSEAVSDLGDDEKIILLKNSNENMVLPAGVKLEQNGFSAPNVVLTPLEIEDIITSRNNENTATIITITYLNTEKITIIEIPDGKDGADGVDGINGTDGVDGINGTDGVDGKDASNTLVFTALVIGGVSLLSSLLILAFVLKKKR